MTATRLSNVADLIRLITDASNFVNSTFWDKNATSGIGGWGDPNDNYQITDGGFATNFSVSYPSPHRPRRQYTPADPDMPGVFLPDSFTPESQMAIVNGFVGDFVSFQVALERGSHGAIHNIVGGCTDLFSALLVCPLTEPTQRSSGGVPFRHPCRLYVRPHVDSQWCASNWCAYPCVRSFDMLIDPLFMLHHGVRRMNASSLIF